MFVRKAGKCTAEIRISKTKNLKKYDGRHWNINVSGTRQSRRHTSMFTVFRSSDDRVLLTMYPAELK